MRITSFDGAEIAVTRMGAGRPLLLIHGFISSGQKNWIEFGTAAMLAAAGFDLIIPDLRGHGASDFDCAYPEDVLRDDMIALLDHLAIRDYDLAGYSLGARTAARLALVRPPRKLVLAGMGLGLIEIDARSRWFVDAIESRAAPRDAAQARVASFLKTMKMDAQAAIAIMRSQTKITAADLARLIMPTLVLAGKEDLDNGPAEALAAALPHAVHVAIRGTHMSAITTPDFGAAIRDFLGYF